MEIKKGIGVSPGVVISTAVVLDAEDLAVPKRQVQPEKIEEEVERFTRALEEAVAELHHLREDVIARQGKEIAGIFDFHLGILRDKSLIDQLLSEIRTHRSTAEYAVSTVMRRYATVFSKIDRK